MHTVPTIIFAVLIFLRALGGVPGERVGHIDRLGNQGRSNGVIAILHDNPTPDLFFRNFSVL